MVNSGGTLQVNSAYTLNLANGTGDDLTVNGNLTVIGAVTYDTGATMAAGSGSTIKFAGTTGGQTTGTGFPSSVYNLIIDNPNGVTLSSNVTITTQLTMTSGAWSLGSNTISYAGGSSLLYNGTSAQTVGGEWPATMSVNITNDNTHSNGLTLNGNKTYNTGTFTNNTILDVGSYAISGSGTVINNDTIISDTSSPVTTSTFTQTSGSTIDYTSDVTLPSPFTYQNLVLSSSGTQFNLSGNINVNESFSTLNSASLDLDTHRMIFPFKYVSVGGDQVITAFTPETYIESPGYSDAVQRKWTFTGAGSGNVDVYLHWDNDQDDGAVFTNGTKIWNYDGSQWITVATLASQQPVADPDNASRTMISFSSSLVAKANVSGQYAVSGYDATLPVELSSFTATISATNYVQLQWVTQSETNVSGYRLYRGSDLDLSTAVMLNAFIEATNTSQMQVYVYWDEEVWESGTYYYWLQNLDFDGSSAFHGPISITVNLNDSGSPVIPVIQGISSIYPNPFNPNTAVRFGIVRSGNVKVAVYNTRGQMVRELFEGFRDQGTHTLQWDGTDANGSALPSGMYVIRMTSGTQVYQRKAILMK